jgi:anti-sigma factor RsiW
MSRVVRLSAGCRALRLDLSQYLDGELPLARRRLIERHLTDCACCGTIAAGLQQTLLACRTTTEKALPRDVRARAANRIRRLLKNGADS